MTFRPNALTPEDLPQLEDWQLLVAACHFGPAMSDCVDLDYAYRRGVEGDILCVGSGPAGRDLSMRDDIDLANPLDALARFAGLTWQDLARQALRARLEACHGAGSPAKFN